MEPLTDAIKPETHALDALIQSSVQQLLTSGYRDGSTSDGLLFLGNWHDAMPRLIFQDPVLQPVDTRIWGVIKIAAAGPRPTTFPTYKQITRTANVGSEATVARSMAILRATRWLSLCRRVRDAQGRYRGNIYALHDEPLPLLDTIYLDQEYLQFLNQAQGHGHPQVRKVAATTMEALRENLLTGRDVAARINPMHRRLEAIDALEGRESRFFGFSSRQLQKLKSVPEDAPLHCLQSDSLQKLKPSPDSSSYNNNKTTTTTTEEMDTTRAHAGEGTFTSPLVLPSSFTANEQRVAMICLGDTPESMRQDILDELAGRMTAAKRRGIPIDNPLGYLSGLCRAARKGEFSLTSTGLRIQEQRERHSREPSLTDTHSPNDHETRDGSALTSSMTHQNTSDTSPVSTPDGTAISPARNPQEPVHKRNGLEACDRALVEMRAILNIRDPALTAPLPTTQRIGDGSAITGATGQLIVEDHVSRPETDGTAIRP